MKINENQLKTIKIKENKWKNISKKMFRISVSDDSKLGPEWPQSAPNIIPEVTPKWPQSDLRGPSEWPQTRPLSDP